MSARCTGIAAQFHSFDFLFGIALGEKVLSLADNLSKALQQYKVNVAEGQAMAALTIQSLRNLQTDTEFHSFRGQVMEILQEADICEPSLPRRRKVPAHYGLGGGDSHTPMMVEDHYCPIF